MAEQLRQKRKRLGLSQAEAAEQLGVVQSYLSKLERGQVSISAEFEQRLMGWLSQTEQA